MPDTPTVVLAHGAWADGSSWTAVITRLRSRGIRAVAAPLPLTTLRDDSAALARTIERIQGPVVVASHAYAGAVAGQTDPARPSALVFIAALAPDRGETVAEVFNRDEHSAEAPAVEPDRHGLIWLPRDAFGEAFAPDASEGERAVLAAVQRPLAAACITVPVDEPAWKHVPSYYLIAERDLMIPPTTQRFMAERMKAEIETHAVDHTPLVTAPDLVADIVARAVDDHARS